MPIRQFPSAAPDLGRLDSVDPLSAMLTGLSMAKDSVTGLGVPGLEAAFGGLNVKDNNDALVSFIETVKHFSDTIVSPLVTIATESNQPITPELHERLQTLARNLNILIKNTERLLARGSLVKFFMNQDDAGTIAQFNKDLDRLLQAFMLKGAILTEVAVVQGHQKLERGLEAVTNEIRRTEAANIDTQEKQMSMAQLQLLRDLPRAQARYDSQSRSADRGCFEGTRTNILRDINNWINNKDPKTPPIFWLCGLAGIGKSTIAHTIAAEEDERHRLGASFFFCRDQAERRDPSLVFPSIAYQLSLVDPELKKLLAEALEKDPDVGMAVMRKQFRKLITEPLIAWNKSERTIVVVMDALDECSPESGAEEILVRWASELRKIPVPLKLLITSRPELHIRSTFQSQSLRLTSQPYILHDIEKSVVQDDIERFLRYRLVEIAEDHDMPTPWPTERELKELVRRADILFIFAATAIKFIASGRRRDPQARLDLLLNEETGNRGSTYREVDALYTQVLWQAIRQYEEEEDVENTQQVLRAVLEAIVILQDTLSTKSLAALLSLELQIVQQALMHLHSVLVVPESPEDPVRTIHPSFPEFLIHPSRCPDPRFRIDAEESHTRLAEICISALVGLKHDPCGVGDPWLHNRQIPNLESRLQVALPQHIRYSCRHFASHLLRASSKSKALLQFVEQFCDKHLLVWIETLSLLDELPSAIKSLRIVRDWYKTTASPNQKVIELLNDAQRVVLRSAEEIGERSGYLYVTALPFSPPCALKTHYAAALPPDYLLRGQPSRWDPCYFTLETCATLGPLAYSYQGDRMVVGDSHSAVRIFNSLTGREMDTLWGHQAEVLSVAFSQDGHRVASVDSDSTGIIWDTTTGSKLATLEGHAASIKFVVFTPDDNTVVTASEDGTLRTWDSSTGKALACRSSRSHAIRAGALSNDGYTVATLANAAIGIWNLRDNDSAKMMNTQSEKYTAVAFLHDNVRLVSGCSSKVVQLWDYQTKTLLQSFGVNCAVNSIAISRSGAVMALPRDKGGLQLWDTNTWSAVGMLKGPSNAVQFLSFSPDGSTLASAMDDGTIRLWDSSNVDSDAHAPAHADTNPSYSYLTAAANGSYAVGLAGDDRFSCRSLKLWDLRTPNSPRTASFVEPACSVVCSSDGSKFALMHICGSQDNPLRLLSVWDSASLRQLFEWTGRGVGSSDREGGTVFSHSGTLLASSFLLDRNTPHGSLRVSVWSTKTYTRQAEFTIQMDYISNLAFSPDDARLFYSSESKYGVWDLSSHRHLVTGEQPWGFNSKRAPPEARPLIMPPWGRDLAHNIKGSDYITVAEFWGTGDDIIDRTADLQNHPAFLFIEGDEIWEHPGGSKDSIGRSESRRNVEDPGRFLCWLPRTWLPNPQQSQMVWTGSHLILVVDESDDICVLDIESLRKAKPQSRPRPTTANPRSRPRP
ncbi:hypothetical protein FRC05_004208 [Tulasnella sp. 425]|nr:hypothetical protein FRC05_004208 [Tulasnella sp. 425]